MKRGHNPTTFLSECLWILLAQAMTGTKRRTPVQGHGARSPRHAITPEGCTALASSAPCRSPLRPPLSPVRAVAISPVAQRSKRSHSRHSASPLAPLQRCPARIGHDSISDATRVPNAPPPSGCASVTRVQSPAAPKFSCPVNVAATPMECVAAALRQAANDADAPARAPRHSFEGGLHMSDSVNGPLVIPESALAMPKSASRRQPSAVAAAGDVSAALQRNSARLSALQLHDRSNQQQDLTSSGASATDRKRARSAQRTPTASAPLDDLNELGLCSPTGVHKRVRAAVADEFAAAPVRHARGDMPAPPQLRPSVDSVAAPGNHRHRHAEASVLAGGGPDALCVATDANGTPLGVPHGVRAVRDPRLPIDAIPSGTCADSDPCGAASSGCGRTHTRSGTGHRWDRFRTQPRLCSDMLERLAACMNK